MHHHRLATLIRFHVVVLTALAVAGPLRAQEPVITPLQPSGVYAPGEKAGWTVALARPSGGASGMAWTYVLKRNGLEVFRAGRLEPAGTARIELTAGEPSMVRLELSPESDDKRKVVAGLAIAPERITPSVPPPADFAAFWEAKIALLRGIPAGPVLTPGESGKEGVEYATLRLNNIDGAGIHGQLAKPAREGRFPAMLLLQWAGGPYPLQKAWVVDRAAEGWLALNIEPHDVPGDMPAAFYAALPQMIKRYHTIYDDDRDRNYFLQMYLGAVRAADYLADRPDWNGRVLLATGTSMGGQQSLAVAGLHPKITHMIVHVPAGADSNALLHGRAAGYPNWDSSRAGVMETALYFDTVCFASRIRATSLVSMGFLDEVCPPAGIWAAFNEIPGRKEAVPLVDAPHNHQATPEQQRAYTERQAAWMAALVRGEEPVLR